MGLEETQADAEVVADRRTMGEDGAAIGVRNLETFRLRFRLTLNPILTEVMTELLLLTIRQLWFWGNDRGPRLVLVPTL
jgi:hypothetical protein